MNRFIKDTKKYWKYTIYAAKSQLKTEVANSYLNWIWWILEPFCFMLIYAFVFGLMFHHKELYYNAYIFVGLAVWDFFNRCIKSSVRMVKRNKSIVSKVCCNSSSFVFLLSALFYSFIKIHIVKKECGLKISILFGGEGGIRTHVPVKANAFRVRPVMTASILLQKYLNILP